MTLLAADMFSGAGGLSEAVRLAGCKVLWAGNHWPAAVHAHAVNHPDAIHACEDMERVDWTQLPRINLLLASPACQGHSRARGKDRPHHDPLRATAFAVVQAIEHLRPKRGLVENVPDMRKWVLFDAWVRAIEDLGYSVTILTLDAADSGVPQHRERLFVVFTRTRSPITLKLQRRTHVPVSSVIDFNVGNWSRIHKPGRARATLDRWENGRKAFGDRFVFPYYSSGSGLTGRSIDRPLGTLTTTDRWAIVDGDRMRMLNIPEAKAVMGMRPDYWLPSDHKTAMKMLGNGVCPPQGRDVLMALQEAL